MCADDVHLYVNINFYSDMRQKKSCSSWLADRKNINNPITH